MYSIGKEVASIRDEQDDAALNLRKSSDVCKLQQQRSDESNDYPNHQTAKEDKQEDAETFKQTESRQ